MKKTRQITYFPLQGGEDLETPRYSIKPGVLKRSDNFECDLGLRYRRIDGYERFDGQTAPSDASYWVLNFDAGQAAISEGDTVTGATSGATGEALIDAVVESGSYGNNDADGYLVLTAVSGTFQTDENLQVAAATKVVADGTAAEKGGASDDNETWIQDAEETARSNISAVPGSGDILGINMYDGTLYAFRADAGDTETCLYKSTSSGWSKVSLGNIIDFDAGTDAFVVGETLTGGTSSATGTIKKVVVQSGTWAGNDADGYIVLHSVSGDFQDNETITSSSGSATSDGADSAISLTTGGRYDFANHNFTGHSGSVKMYGCDGVNHGFEFDGTTYIPIRTGMTTDTPEHIAAHKQHLFFSFSGGSVQHSSIGEPFEWSPVTGASEIGLGADVTGLEVMPGDTLAIFGRNRTSILYGTSSSDWVLKQFSREAGAIEWSIQKTNDLLFMDDKGVSSLKTVQAYGDFEASTLSRNIQDVIDNKKEDFVASVRVKNKNQYRLYFSDNTGICMTISRNGVAGFTRLNYEDAITCVCSTEDSNGSERLFFGSDDGMIYELDSGTSFDGESIRCFLRTWPVTLQNPERKKRFFKIVVEKDNTLSEGYWGIGEWGDFEWGFQGSGSTVSYVDDKDTGYEYLYTADEIYTTPYTLQGVILHYSNGGLNR